MAINRKTFPSIKQGQGQETAPSKMIEEASNSGDKVAFISIPGSYKPGESAHVRYKLCKGLVTHNRDWIGVFKVGWTSNRDYYTFEWAPFKKENSEEESESVRVVKFAGSRLPPDDGAFYQFCYVVYSGTIKGASRPFQFSNSTTGLYTDELELIEINEEDSLLLLRTHHDTQVSELHKEVELLTQANVDVEASFVQIKSEHGKLLSETDQLKEESKVLTIQLAEAKEEIATKEQELKRQQFELTDALKVKQQEIGYMLKGKDDMKDELDDVTSHVQQLLLTEERKENDLKAAREMIERLLNEKEAIIAEKMETETHLRVNCSQLEERQRKLEEEKEVSTGRSEYYQAEVEGQHQRMEAMKVQIVCLEGEVNELTQELGKEKFTIQTLCDKLVAKEQELNVLQQNVCEIAGNIKEPFDQLPQSTDKVDRSALEALQMAYEDIEQRLKHEQKQNRSLRKKINEIQERIRLCEEEYTQVASENKNVKKKLKRLESCTPTTTSYEAEVTRLGQELEVFQLKHDERIAEKNDVMQKLTEELGLKDTEIKDLRDAVAGLKHQEQAMKRSIETLNIENGQLKRKLQGERPPPQYTPHPHNPPHNSRPVHQAAPRRPQPEQRPSADGSRICPLCNLAFPARSSQDEFEQHVNTHFQGN